MTDDRTFTGDSAPDAPRTLGAILAAARAERGLSVEDVAAATRIRSRLVTEIERDRFDNLGGTIYARGHIKAIAHEVGADADLLIEMFDRDHGGAPAPQLQSGSLPKLTMPGDRDAPRTTRRSSPRWASAAIAVLAVGAIFLGVTWFAGRGNDDPQGTTAQDVGSAQPTTTSEPTPAPTETGTTTAPSTTPPKTTPPPSGVSVRAQVTDGESWIEVRTSSGQTIFSQILGVGQVKEWHDPERLIVKIGYAPAVHLVVNGRDVGVPCDRTVCTVQYPSAAVAG